MGTPIPPNKAAFSLRAIAEATGGAIVSSGSAGGGSKGDEGAQIEGISTDTRALAEGAAFVAIKGSTYDGHEHLDAAVRAGARAAVVERDVEAPPGLAIVRVASTVAALGALARAHTRSWRAGQDGARRTLIGITGSAGKTTTRVALSALLEKLRPGEVHATHGNLNNLIGAPMVLLGLTPAHKIAVIEIATNAPGEIAALSAIAEPDVGIVTLIDAAHCEGLGSLDGVSDEKGALFRALPPSGHAIGNADNERVMRELARSSAENKHTYAIHADADARVAVRVLDGMTRSRMGLTLRSAAGGERRIDFATPLLGEAGALACAAAVLTAEISLGERVTGELAEAAFATADVGGGAGRLVPRVLPDGLVLIDDSYNANPASSCASIRAASEIAHAAGRRLVLILGEMRELGPEAARGHDQVGEAAGASGAAEVIAVMGEARRIAERASEAGVRATFAETLGEALDIARSTVRSGDVVLVKGSRSVATDKIARALIADEARATAAPRGASDGGNGSGDALIRAEEGL
jgi:UDP-N-acetylmuramoyl-tripeptide--D-alanyl-D-alanine ligase